MTSVTMAVSGVILCILFSIPKMGVNPESLEFSSIQKKFAWVFVFLMCMRHVLYFIPLYYIDFFGGDGGNISGLLKSMNDTGGKQQPSKAPITYQGFLVDTTTLSSAFLIQCEIPKKMPEQSHAWIGKRCISMTSF